MADDQCLSCSLPDGFRSELEHRIASGAAFTEISRWLESCGHRISESSIRRHRDNHLQGDTTRDRLGKIAELLEQSGISLDEVGRIDKLTFGTYQAITKDSDGEAEIHDLEKASIVLSPKWAEGPAWPVVDQAPVTPVVVQRSITAAKPGAGWKRAVILPDIQAGFFRDLNDVLHPIHDEGAIDIALQVVAAAKPDVIVMVGDGADFAEMSRFRTTPAFARTVQETINWVERFVAKLRALSPDAHIAWISGNHESRAQNYILDNAIAAFGLRRGNEPSTWPVMSFPHLCRFEEHNIEWVGGYPAGEFWINDRLRVIHGDKVSSGSTAHKYLDEDRVSTIFGHVHRRELAERTRHTREGPRTIMAMSPGCLCRTDGAVPSTKQGVDEDGIPITRYENWQNGVAVVEYEEGDGRFAVEQVPIHHGWGRWRGHDFYASVDCEGRQIA